MLNISLLSIIRMYVCYKLLPVVESFKYFLSTNGNIETFIKVFQTSQFITKEILTWVHICLFPFVLTTQKVLQMYSFVNT